MLFHGRKKKVGKESSLTFFLLGQILLLSILVRIKKMDLISLNLKEY